MQHFSRAGLLTLLTFVLFSYALVFGMTEAEPAQTGSEYSFVYLGDLHFDHTTHHDFAWLQATKPDDIRQIERYVRNTETYTPRLLKQIRTLSDLSEGGIQMALQGGDLTEGLCGSYALQMTQFAYAKDIIRHHLGAVPFIAAKGNHDITGPGAAEAYASFMLPWMSTECGKPLGSASFYFMKGPDLFVIFDAYHNANPDWLEKTLKDNQHRYAFVVVHPPVVPYSARSTWHLFSKADEVRKRDAMLNILGGANAIVLTGHLHKYSVVGRKTPTGAFVQFSISSVISSSKVTVNDFIKGVERYNGELVTLEPDFQPETVELRKKLLEDERGSVTYFEYADFAGDAILHVSDAGITADIYAGDSDTPWKTLDLGSILEMKP